MKQTISKYGNKSRQSGWHNESVRHSLASKGIKTGKINYSRLDGLVKTKETQYAKLPQGQQGGLSADVTLSNKFNEYTRGVAVFGYIGSSGRTTTRDEILENELREQGLGGEGIATWLTSTVARHLMDPVDKNMSDTDFRKRVKEYTKNAFKDVAIWSHPDFQGTLGSSIGLKKKFHDAQFAKFDVKGVAIDRKTREQVGKIRTETIDNTSNNLFKHCNTNKEVESAYESFWNDLDPHSQEIVKVIGVKKR